VPAQMTIMPPRLTTNSDTGSVDWPGCSKTKSTLLPLPVTSQMAAPNLRALLNQASYSGVPTFGNSPQQAKFLRLMTPRAPSCMTKSRLSSSDTMPMALAPDVAHSCTAMEPSPPEAPQTSTLWPGADTCGPRPNTLR